MWFLTHNREFIALVKIVVENDDIMLFGRRIRNPTNFFEKPIKSSALFIYTSILDYDNPTFYETQSIFCKLVAVETETKGNFVFMPLVHTL